MRTQVIIETAIYGDDLRATETFYWPGTMRVYPGHDEKVQGVQRVAMAQAIRKSGRGTSAFWRVIEGCVLLLTRLPLRSRSLCRREQVGLVPGVKLGRVAVALDRDHAPHLNLRALPEPA